MLDRRRRGAWIKCLAALLLMTAGVAPGRCDDNRDSSNDRAARVASDALLPFLALGEVCLATGEGSSRDALRGAGAVLTTAAVTEALKRLVRAPRPDKPDERDSFPSGHASTSFAMAAVLSRTRPGLSSIAYGGATLISLSRIKLRRHRLHEVVVGAGLGYFIGSRFARRRGEDSRSSSLFTSAGLNRFQTPGARFRQNALAIGAPQRSLLLSTRGIGLQMQW